MPYPDHRPGATSHPIGRIGEPGEVTAAIAFLLSDDASFITGAVLPADGESTAGIDSAGEQADDAIA